MLPPVGFPSAVAPVVRGVALEVLDLLQERPGRGGIAHVLQHVGLGADEFVGLGQVRGAAVADHLLRHPAGECVAGDAGEGVRAAALERKAEVACRLRRAFGRGNVRQPALDQRRRARDLVLEPALDAEERVWHVVERVTSPLHEPPQVIIAVGAGTVVGGKHRAHVGMHHEAREHAQHVAEIVGPPAAAALGMGHRHHAVDPGGGLGRRPLRHRPHETVGARGGGQYCDEVASPDTAPAGAAEAVEGRRGCSRRDLRARREAGLVQRVGLDGVHEVGGFGEREVDVARRERAQDPLVADVLAGREVTDRDAEREAPGGQMRALPSGHADEAMPFEDGVGQAKLTLAVRDEGAGLEAPRRDRDVVGFRRHAGHPVEFETIVHRAFPGTSRHTWHGRLQYRETPPKGSLGSSHALTAGGAILLIACRAGA